MKALMTQTRAARLLKVTRGHLNMVLRGHRQSRSLLARYEALQVKEAKRMANQANPRFSQDLAPATRQATGPASATASSPRSADGASNNLCPEWGELVGRLGFCVCVVS